MIEEDVLENFTIHLKSLELWANGFEVSANRLAITKRDTRPTKLVRVKLVSRNELSFPIVSTTQLTGRRAHAKDSSNQVPPGLF
jgi:hypothetical protein